MTQSGSGKKKQAITRQSVTLGEAVQLTGGIDREAQIRNTLERLKQEKTLQAQRESEVIVQNAHQQAEAILAQAKEKAAQIIADGEAGKEAIHQEGYNAGKEEGYQDGYRDGRDAADQDSRLLMLSANTLLVRAYEAQSEILKGFNSSAITIMKAILKRVLDDTFEQYTDDQWVFWLNKTIEQLNIYGKFKLVISDTSFQQFKGFSPKLAEALGSLDRFQLIVDPNLDVTEMYILGDEANMDISPMTQVEQFLEALTAHLCLNESMDAEQLNPAGELDELAAVLEPYFDSPEAVDGESSESEETPSGSSQTKAPEFTASENGLTDSVIVPDEPQPPSVGGPVSSEGNEPLLPESAPYPIRPLSTQDRLSQESSKVTPSVPSESDLSPDLLKDPELDELMMDDLDTMNPQDH